MKLDSKLVHVLEDNKTLTFDVVISTRKEKRTAYLAVFLHVIP
jgi:hypothetical protein